MISVIAILLLAAIVQTHAEEPAANLNSKNHQISLDMLVSKLVDKLTQRTQSLKAFPLHSVDMDKTTLEKSRSVTSVPVVAGACSANDHKAMWALGSGTEDGSWPQVCNDCAHSALNIFTGIEQTAFNSCLMEQAPISTGCSTCFAEAAQYAFNQCKLACMTSPWTDGCLTCVKGFNTERCAGFELPQATPTNEGEEDNVTTQTFHGPSDHVTIHDLSCHIIIIFAVSLLGLVAGRRFKSSNLQGRKSIFDPPVGKEPLTLLGCDAPLLGS